jgi:uncharacterized protein
MAAGRDDFGLRGGPVVLLEQLFQDPRVRPEVKALLRREYPSTESSFSIFIEHSEAVAEYAVELARKCGARVDFVREAAWLHDVGIKYTNAPGIDCHGEEPYMKHGIIGRGLCESEGLSEHGLVCERHVGTGLTAAEIQRQQLPLPARDMLCQTTEERIVCYADQFFSKTSSERLDLEEVVRRTKHHGEAGYRRFQQMHAEFSESEGSPRESA